MGKGKNSSKVENKLDKLLEMIERNEEKASARHKEITKRLDDIEYEVEKCKRKDRLMCDEINKLKTSINDLEQAQLANSINIRGIAEVEDNAVDLKDAIVQLFQAVSNDINSFHVLKVQRIGKSREGFTRPILVQLSLKTIKDILFESAKNAPLDCSLISHKSLPWGTKENQIFLGHHLTREKSTLFYEARKLRKAGTVKHAWVKDGQILIKKDDTSKPIYLKRLDDINIFLGKRKRIFNSTKKDGNKSETFKDSSDESEDSDQNTEASEDEDTVKETNKRPDKKRQPNKRTANSPAGVEQPSQRPKRVISQKQY